MAAAGAHDDSGGERLTLRQARVLDALSVTLRSLQRRGLIVAAAREHARADGWVLRRPR